MENKLEEAVREMMVEMRIPLEPEVLKQTPRRVAEMYEELLSGYFQDAELDVQFTEASDLVMISTEFMSLCEHHILPFYGTVYIGYLPDEKLAGASKLPRLVEKYARRLQLQERMTNEIAQELMEELMPQGCIVVIEGTHLCMKMRGIKKSSKMVTSAIRGKFEEPALRMEFLELIKVLDLKEQYRN